MPRKYYLIGSLVLLTLNLLCGNSLFISAANVFSYLLAVSLIVHCFPNSSKYFPLLPAFSFMPLYTFAPRYPHIALLEIICIFCLLIWSKNKSPAALLISSFSLIFGLLLQINIINLPISFDPERLIFPDHVTALQIHAIEWDALYLPYRIRYLTVYTLGYAQVYLNNLFSFLKSYNFLSTLLFINAIFLPLGIYNSRFQIRRTFPFLIFSMLTFLLAGLIRLPDKFLVLYMLRSSLIAFAFLGISTSRISSHIYYAGLLFSLFLTLHVWI